MDELAEVLLQVYGENVIDKSYVEEKRVELENASKYEVWHLAARLNDDSLMRFSELLAKRVNVNAEELEKAIKLWRYVDFNIDLTSNLHPKSRM